MSLLITCNGEFSVTAMLPINPTLIVPGIKIGSGDMSNDLTWIASLLGPHWLHENERSLSEEKEEDFPIYKMQNLVH